MRKNIIGALIAIVEGVYMNRAVSLDSRSETNNRTVSPKGHHRWDVLAKLNNVSNPLTQHVITQELLNDALLVARPAVGAQR